MYAISGEVMAFISHLMMTQNQLTKYPKNIVKDIVQGDSNHPTMIFTLDIHVNRSS